MTESCQQSHQISSPLAEKKLKLAIDSIDQLPDDILVEIISNLTLKEAVRTSVLSTRWKNLWTFINVLHFDAPRKLWFGPRSEERNNNYINWVNEILQLHKASNLIEFRIKFDLFCNHTRSITDWICTAIAKGVQHLELNLTDPGKKSYVFPPLESFGPFSRFKSFKSLCFVSVDVSREILEFFICNCPVLERLDVKHSKSLRGLKVVGSSIRLKYLELSWCSKVKEIEISAPSLRSFKFHGSNVKLRIENVPQLVDVSIGRTASVPLKNLVEPVSKYLPQLETLQLELYLHMDKRPFPLPQLPKLRHLILSVEAHGRQNLGPLTRMIKDIPFLHKFTLQVNEVEFLHDRLRNCLSSRRRKIRRFRKWPHRHLKVVELIGFGGETIDLEFAFSILENAIMLEKMIINTNAPTQLGSYREHEDNELKIAARKRAKVLEEKLPQGVQLVVH